MSACYFSDLGGCDPSILDQAHIIPKQRIKRVLGKDVPDSILWDERVLFTLCRAHHTAFDAKLLRLKRDELPIAVEWFAAEHPELAWSLERDFGPAEVRCRAQISDTCHQLTGTKVADLYGEDGMPDDRTYEERTHTVVCNACYISLGCPKFRNLNELEQLVLSAHREAER